jgi:cytochrome P450
MGSIDAREFFTAAAIEDPYNLYARMRAIAPVCQIGETRAFLVSSHAAVEEAVRRHGEFSAHLKGMLVCDDGDRPYIYDLAAAGIASHVIATADEPEHAVHRRLMLPPLKAARIAELEPELRVFARERVRHYLQSGGGDICAALAETLPAYVVIRLLDLGEHALEAVRRWAMMGGDFLAGRLSAAAMQRVFTESLEQYNYLSAHFDVVRARREDERGDSLTATLAGGVDAGLVTRDEAIGILLVLFGAAGESTASLLGCAIRRLVMDASLQDRLRAAPALIPNFIEEVARLEPPFKFHYRVVNCPATLGGTALETGDLLLLGWAAANRDPKAWEHPDDLRLDRAKPERHLGFGYGIHFCIGAPLARLEVRVALEELLAGTQRIELDPQHPFLFAPSIFVRRLQQLHLRTA